MNKSNFSIPHIVKQIAYLIAVILIGIAIQKWAIDTQFINPFITLNLLFIAINIILGVSLNLINGFTGQFSIGHAGFMAIGAYVSAIVTVNLHDKLINALHLSFLTQDLQNIVVFIIAILAGAISAAIMGFLVGLPTLRLKGDYLAIATLGFGEIIRIVILNIDYVGGPRGFTGIPPYTTFTWALVLAVLTTWIIYNFTKSSHGRACISIRENEIAAEAMGINTTKYKVMAFTIGSFFAGVGGALFAHVVNIVSPVSFTFMRSVDILVIIVLGGLGSLRGTIIAAFVLTAFSAAMADYPEIRMIFYSALLVVLMLMRFGNKNLFLTRILANLKRSDKNVVAEGK